MVKGPIQTSDLQPSSLQPQWAKDVIAITGVSGSGKSEVVKLLAARGAYVVDADALAREVVLPGTAGLEQIRCVFGDSVLNPDGTLNRSALGKIIFGSPEQRAQLETILHPLIAAKAGALFSSSEAKRASVRVYDVPLLFEAGLHTQGFNKIIVVSAERETCISRIMARDNLSREAAEKRIFSQIPIEQKRAKADIVIANDGSREMLANQVDKIFESLK